MSIQMQADDFFNAYLVLKENNENFIEKQSVTSSKSPIGKNGLGKRFTAGVDIVCLAFSVELYIKDLHYANNGHAPKGHNILKLFEKLPEQIRKEIFAYDSISPNPFITRGDKFSTKRFTIAYTAYDGFIDQIKSISDGFEKWRYSYESSTLHYNSSFALALVEAIKSAADKIRK